MKILVTGSRGQLGSYLIRKAPISIDDNHLEILTPNRDELDLSNPDNCFEYVSRMKPDWIINSAAFTAVDLAENSPELVYKVNTEAPLNFAKALANYNGKLLQISTDYVFDGMTYQPYKPDHEKNPLGIYGDSKSKAEDLIMNKLFPNNQAKIIRTSWILGPEKNNFALKILELCQKNEILKIVSDQIGSPCSVINLSLACWRVIDFFEKGISLPDILHWSDYGVASWFDIAVEICDLGSQLGLINGKKKVMPISTAQYPTLAKRPSFSLLECSETITALQLEPSHWRYSLLEILELHKKYFLVN